MLADCLADIDCIVTIGVHATAQAEKQDSKSLSEKQAGQIFNMLVKYGMGKDNIIVAGYGKEKVVQGWENVDCVDIGIIRK